MLQGGPRVGGSIGVLGGEGAPPGIATTSILDSQKACWFVRTMRGNIHPAEQSKWQVEEVNPGLRLQGQQSGLAGIPARVLGWVLREFSIPTPEEFPETLSINEGTPLRLRAPKIACGNPERPLARGPELRKH